MLHREENMFHFATYCARQKTFRKQLLGFKEYVIYIWYTFYIIAYYLEI